MVIIGITGGIGHGKTSLAEAFQRAEPRSRHFESSTLLADVITVWQERAGQPPDPHNLVAVNGWVAHLPEALKQVAHASIDASKLEFDAADIAKHPELYEKLFAHLVKLQQKPALMHTRITEANKADFRPLLQWLGGYITLQVDPRLWFTELMRQAEQTGSQGVRLSTIGGVRFPINAEIIHEHGGYVVGVQRPHIGETELDDLTERDRRKTPMDTILVNNGTLAELEAAAKCLYRDIRLNRRPQKHYAAAQAS